MNLSAQVQRRSESILVPGPDDLTMWANAAFTAVMDEPAEVTIRIVDEAEGVALNRDYRGREGATNVLSFSYGRGPFEQPGLLGDVVICAPVVEREARSQNKSIEAHWAHMVVHGVLHLCGYDHEKARDAREMERLESRILLELGFPAPYG